MRRPAAAAALVMSLALVACSGSGESVAVDTVTGAPGTEATEATDAAGTDTTAAESDATEVPGLDLDIGDGEVRLIDAGEEPRVELRHEWAVGDYGVMRTTSSQTIAQSFDGGPREATRVPAMTIDAEVEVVAVDEGVATIVQRAVEASAAESDPDPVMADVIAALGSLTTELVLGPRGEVLDSSVEMGAGDIPGIDVAALAESASQGAVTFPEEAVGEGATWEVTTTASVLGVTVTQTATYRILELRPDGVLLSFTIEQQPPVDLDIPGLPEDAEVEVVQWEMEGNGRSEVRFGHPVVEVQLNMSGLQILEIGFDGESGSVLQELTSTMQVTLVE